MGGDKKALYNEREYDLQEDEIYLNLKGNSKNEIIDDFCTSAEVSGFRVKERY